MQPVSNTTKVVGFRQVCDSIAQSGFLHQ